jgi:WD40 repeat protein
VPICFGLTFKDVLINMSHQLLACATQKLQIWEFVQPEEHKLHSTCDFGGRIKSLSWNHTNQVVAVGGSSSQIGLIQASNGQLLSTLPFTGEAPLSGECSALKFSSNSRYLAASEGSLIRLWDLKKRNLKAALEGHVGSVVALSFFADGTIVSGDNREGIRIWDVKSNSSSRPLALEQKDTNRPTIPFLSSLELSYIGTNKIGMYVYCLHYNSSNMMLEIYAN